MIAPEPSGLYGPHVRQFVRARGTRILEALREQPRPDATWRVHSHGAYISVVSPSPELFDRLVLLLVASPNQPADRFMDWGQKRLKRLGEYMEACDTGRVLQVLPGERSLSAILVRRVGVDPASPDTELPPPEALPPLLARFVVDIQRYIRHMGDEELHYIEALRLHRIPRGRSPEFLLGLDVLPTAVGSAAEPVGIEPVALVRGVALELLSRLEAWLKEPSSGSLLERLAERSQRSRGRRLARALKRLIAQIDAQRPSVRMLHRWLRELKVPLFPGLLPALLGLGLVTLGALGYWLVWP